MTTAGKIKPYPYQSQRSCWSGSVWFWMLLPKSVPIALHTFHCPSCSCKVQHRVRSAFCRRSLHGHYWMGALSQKFTMEARVFLLLLAAFTCGLAQVDENTAEELQVETLVSWTHVLHCNTVTSQQQSLCNATPSER